MASVVASPGFRVPFFAAYLTCPVQLCLMKTAYALFIPQYTIPVLVNLYMPAMSFLTWYIADSAFLPSIRK